MRENFPASLDAVLKHEGGYSNHPNDAGGATMNGVTQAVYDGYRRRRGQIPRSVRMLERAELEAIYRQLYWDKIDGDFLPAGIDYCTFDAAVNSGYPRAAKWLQQAINRVAKTARLKVDSNIGPATVDASDDYPADAIIDAAIDARLGFMKIARNSKTGRALWPSFGEGWSNRLFGYLPKGKTVRRADGVDDIAKWMAGKNPQPVAKSPLPPAPLPTSPQGDRLPPWLAALLAALLAAMGIYQWLT